MRKTAVEFISRDGIIRVEATETEEFPLIMKSNGLVYNAYPGAMINSLTEQAIKDIGEGFSTLPLMVQTILRDKIRDDLDREIKSIDLAVR